MTFCSYIHKGWRWRGNHFTNMMQLVPNFNGFNETFGSAGVLPPAEPLHLMFSLFSWVSTHLAPSVGGSVDPNFTLSRWLNLPRSRTLWHSSACQKLCSNGYIWASGGWPKELTDVKRQCRNTSLEVKIHREAPKRPEAPRWGRFTPPWAPKPTSQIWWNNKTGNIATEFCVGKWERSGIFYV